MVNLYMTDYGPVRVSDNEAHTLQLAEDIRRGGDEDRFPKFIATAESIKAACERVAKFKEGVRD